MARRIQIILPDGIHKRTAVASVDKSEKMGPNFYLEIFAKGLLVCENEIKEQRQQKPKGKQWANNKKTKKILSIQPMF